MVPTLINNGAIVQLVKWIGAFSEIQSAVPAVCSIYFSIDSERKQNR